MLSLSIVALAGVRAPTLAAEPGPDETGAAIANLSLSVTPNTAPAGVSAIPTAGIDLNALEFGPGGLGSLPLRSSPLRSSPLHSSPLRSSPLRSSPLRSSPLRSSPLHSSPLHSSPIASAQLPPMPLSTVPLFRDGGWAPRLVGTPYERWPLTAVLLQDVIDLAGQTGGSPPTPTYPLLNSLTLADVDINSTPLRSLPINGFLFSGPTLDQLSPSADWCGQVASPTFSCAAKGISESVATLLDLYVAGADPVDLGFVGGLPVNDADLTGSVIANYDVASVNVAATSLGAIPVRNLPPGIVDCSRMADCSSATLADAVAANAIFDTNDAVLGRILADDALVGTLTFGELVRSVLDPAKVDYSRLPLGPLLTQAPLGSRGLVDYAAEAEVRCDPASDLSVTVELPAGFRYAPGTATQSIDGGRRESAGEPTVLPSSSGGTGPQLRWPITGVTCVDPPGVAHISLAFEALPGATLGLQTSNVEVASSSAAASLMGVAPVGVTEVFEPNDDPASATPVATGVLYLSHISTADDVDFYELPPGLPAGTRVSAVLSHLPSDYDLLLDAPVAAPLRSSPLQSSPLRSSPIEDLGLTGDRGGEVIAPDTLQDVPLRSSTLSHSAKSGLENEWVTTVLTAPATSSEPVTLEVFPHGRSSSDEPYMLQVFTQPPPELNCPTPFVLGDGGGEPGTLPTLTDDDRANGRTLYLINQKRFGDLYTQSRASQVRAALDQLAAQPGESRGVVIPVEGDADVMNAYRAWDDNRCSPQAANDVVRAIGMLVDTYAAQMPDLRYITVVGDDNVIPFARIPDGTTLSNQRDYAPEVVFGGEDNPISAAFAHGYVLSDDVLAAKTGIDFLGHQLPNPHYAAGRLVETPDEILGTIRQYQTQPFVTFAQTLTTGYDFLFDSATAIDATFERAQADQRLPPNRQTLISETWSKQDLVDALNAGPSVAAINAHFDHYNALPPFEFSSPAPAPTLFSSNDVQAAALPPGSLLFSVGCQAGLNLPDVLAPLNTRVRDWAQALVQKQAVWLGSTTFSYGDTEAVAYSEHLLTLFAANLDGSTTVGQAVAQAKRDYLATGLVSVYDEKALVEATFYGLPFVTVGPAGSAAPPPNPGPGVLTDTFLGIPVHLFTWQELYTFRTTTRGSYYTIGDQAPLVQPYRPIQPADVEDLPNPPSGTQLGDVLFTGLESLPDEHNSNPVIARPTVDLSAHEPEPDSTNPIFPSSLGTVTPAGSLALFPGQHRSDATPGAGTQLRFRSMDGLVFYPSSTAGAGRPSFRDVDGTSTSTGVDFRVEVGPADYVSVLYRKLTPDPDGNFTWGQVALEHEAPGSDVWTATVPETDVAEFFVQAVNDGLVGTTRSKGLNYVPVPEANVTVTGTQGNNGWYIGVPDPVTVDVISADATFTISVDGGSPQPVPVTITTDGVHSVSYIGSNGATGSLTVPIDASAPTVHFFQPTQGATYPVGANVTASFSCADIHSGVATCQALDPLTLDTSPGTHTFRVHVEDNAGNDAIRTVTYSARYVFEGFFAPVDNPDVWNTARAGTTIPVKFRLRLADGTVVSDTAAVVQPIESKPISCEDGATDAIELFATIGTSSLRFDAEGEQFVYSWKTERAWAGSCRQLEVKLVDGTTHLALFSFTR